MDDVVHGHWDSRFDKLAEALAEIFQKNFSLPGAPADQWDVQLDLFRYLYWVN